MEKAGQQKIFNELKDLQKEQDETFKKPLKP